MDTIDPNDLAMFRTAQQTSAQATQQLHQAQEARLIALGKLQAMSEMLTQRYGLGPTDRVNTETGAITRGEVAPEQPAAVPGPDRHPSLVGRRRKG